MYSSLIKNCKHAVHNQKVSKVFPYFLFAVLALAPFLWHTDLLSAEFIGSGDYLSPYVSPEWITQTTNVYGPQVGGGADYAYLLAYLFLYNLPVRLLHFIGLSGPIITILLLSSFIFVSQFSMYKFVEYILTEKFRIQQSQTKYLTTIGGILYGFSPYVVGIIAPGHIFQLYSYMIFPLLLLYLDRLLSFKAVYWKYFVVLYYIFFLSSPAYANIGILYLTFLIIGIYYLVLLLVYRKNFIANTLKITSVFLLAVLANIWWILPYAANFGQALSVNAVSTVINDALATAVNHATISNIFYGRAETLFFKGLPNDLYSHPLLFILFAGLLILAFTPLIQKVIQKGYLYVLSLLLVVGAFITKGPNDPMGFIFTWMYDIIPGFQIFRRPVSKFYWFFLLIFFAMAIIGAALILQRAKKNIVSGFIVIFLAVISSYFVIAFIKTPLLITFTVPQYYYQAKEYLQNTQANRVLVIPGFFGTYPTYNSTIKNYYGVDFIPFIWPYEIVEPNSTSYGVSSPTKNEVNSLTGAIVQSKEFCTISKILGISHIVIRQDIDHHANTENTPDLYIGKMRKRQEIREVKSFAYGKSGILVYTLKDACRETRMIISSGADIQYSSQSPTLITGIINKSTHSAQLSLLQNETNQWRLYTMDTSTTFAPILSFLKVYKEISKTPSPKEITNTWAISPSSNDMKFVLFYQSQAYFLIGLAVLAITNVIIISLVLYSHDQRNHQKSSK